MVSNEKITKQELKNAPLRKQWAKHGRNIKIIVLVNVALYLFMVFQSYVSYYRDSSIDPLNLLLGLFFIAGPLYFAVNLGWNIFAFSVIYAIYSFFKIKRVKSRLIEGLINNSQLFDLDGLSRETGIPLPDINVLTKEMIAAGTIQGSVRDNFFVPAGTVTATRQPASVRTKKPVKRPTVRSTGALTVFLSYATVDSDKYQIPLIADLLENKPGIEKVFYWQEHASGSIIEYMSKSIEVADTCIFFYSPTAAASSAVQKERDMAVYQGKHVIPVFTDINDVPAVLRTDAGVNASNKSTEEVVEELYRLISRR